MSQPPAEPGKEGMVKMFMLRVTSKLKLKLEDFSAPVDPGCSLQEFRNLLENVAQPYLKAAISSRELVELDSDDDADDPSPKLDDSEIDQFWIRDMALSREQRQSWSYRLSEQPTADGRTKILTDWLPIDTEERYKKMVSSVKESHVSAVLIRTGKIYDAKYAAGRRNRAESEQPGRDGVPQQAHLGQPATPNSTSSCRDAENDAGKHLDSLKGALVEALSSLGEL
ncbi:hypothetical protein GGS23DRAFT_7928 [Durotheca rogersii]|uniref:uncharacterized protein n=1 Tax=Durotheca rogersii TaxID=419775 RepID=UPI002220BA58|nr:uncharacterized protein GGS23DRAFT_7928 [Durotheca rogersii]KAI5868028.1 hypothetical protein GGS23DRAFT_7928 [Durotheca rogersii]